MFLVHNVLMLHCCRMNCFKKRCKRSGVKSGISNTSNFLSIVNRIVINKLLLLYKEHDLLFCYEFSETGAFLKSNHDIGRACFKCLSKIRAFF